MKSLCACACFVLIALNSFGVQLTLFNSGPLTIKLMATAQASESVTSSKTNVSGSTPVTQVTTVTTVSKLTVSNSFIAAADFLNLLENTFSTSLPAGSQLVINRDGPYYHLYVTDNTGTNVVLNPGTNAFIGVVGNEQPVHAGTQTLITKTGNNFVANTGNLAETVTQTVVLGYDDSGVATQDGTHTKFFMTLLVVRKTSENLVTLQIKDTLKLQGVGNGIVRDKNVILQGSGSATITGALFPPPP